LGLILLGPFLYAIGVSLGPLMISGLVTPWTRDYFTKWVQFLVIAAGLEAVIGVVLTIATSVITHLSGSALGSDSPTAVSMFILTVMVMVVNSLIGQAPGIASALFPGHVGASKGGGEAMNRALKNMKPAKEAANAAGRTVAKSASQTLNLTKQALGKIYAKKP
jgi:type IV secretory pathway VirB6-like protein